MSEKAIIRSIYEPFEKRAIETGESLTKQSFKDECDINYIMERFQRTGILPDQNPRQPVYGDFSSVLDFQTAQAVIAESMIQFQSLPAKIRERFGHDPVRFLDYVNKAENIQEMIDLGIIIPRQEEQKPVKEEVK